MKTDEHTNTHAEYMYAYTIYITYILFLLEINLMQSINQPINRQAHVRFSNLELEAKRRK